MDKKIDDFEHYIDKIRNDISNIYNEFYIWKGLTKKEYYEIYIENEYFWGIVLVSLQLDWLLRIAKLFEESKEEQEVISIPFLLKFVVNGDKKEKINKEIDKQRPVLDNLWKWRCKILAHQDKIVADNLADFYKEYPIKGIEIENLLVSIKDILGLIKSSALTHSETYSFKTFQEKSERDDEQIIKKLKYFSQEKRKHMEKFKRGETDKPHFPPSE